MKDKLSEQLSTGQIERQDYFDRINNSSSPAEAARLANELYTKFFQPSTSTKKSPEDTTPAFYI